MNTRHRTDFLPHVLPGTHKHGIDQAGSGQARFADQAAKRFRAAQTPGPMRGEAHAFFAPAGAAFAAAKCFSRALITDAVVVSAATTMREDCAKCASRKAFAVTGPTATKAILSFGTRNPSIPNSVREFCTADGLKNNTASVSPFVASCNLTRSTSAGRSVLYAITSVTTAPWPFNAAGKLGL